MPANVLPVFPITPVVSWSKLTAANTAHDGTGAVAKVFTAGGNGARVDRIKVRALGTNVATVLRIFINNGSANTTAANNTLYMEKTVPATTLTEVAELKDTVITLDMALPAGYVINCTIGTAVAAGLAVTCEGGNF